MSAGHDAYVSPIRQMCSPEASNAAGVDGGGARADSRDRGRRPTQPWTSARGVLIAFL